MLPKSESQSAYSPILPLSIAQGFNYGEHAVGQGSGYLKATGFLEVPY